MAVDPNSNPAKSTARQPGGRTTPALIPLESLAGQAEVPLDRPVTTVGSNDSARLHLVSRTVSKGHALFVNSGGTTYVADLASRTGVLVNGRQVRDADLKTGDRIQIGKFVFRFRSPNNAAPPAPGVVPPAATVIVVGSQGKPIEGRIFQIGRRENSDVCFPTDAAVSAGHAVIFEMDGQWHLRDLGSRTGTIVNGKQIHQHPLMFGDRIVIGSSNILFQPGAETTIESPVESVEPEADVEEWSEPVEAPLESRTRDKHAVATPASAMSEEDAIPLADEAVREEPTHAALDWKSAFPASEIEEALAPIDLEPAVPEKLSETEELPLREPFSESINEQPAVGAVDSVFAEKSNEPRPLEHLPAPELHAEAFAEDQIPLELPAATTDSNRSDADEPPTESEPVAVESIEELPPLSYEPEHEPVAPETIQAIAAESPEFTTAIPSSEPVAEQQIPLELSPQSAESMVDDKPIPLEALEELATESPESIDLHLALEPASEHPVEVESSAQVAEPVAQEEMIPVEAVEPIQTPASQPIEVESTQVAEPIVEEEPLSVEVLQRIGNPEPEPITEQPIPIELSTQAAEPIVEQEPQPIEVVESFPTPTPEPVAEAPLSFSTPEITRPSFIAPVPADLVSPVEDFVFVPGEETTDASALPDLIFWGDDELDFAAEQVIAASPTPLASPEPAPVEVIDTAPAEEFSPPASEPVEASIFDKGIAASAASEAMPSLPIEVPPEAQAATDESSAEVPHAIDPAAEAAETLPTIEPAEQTLDASDLVDPTVSGEVPAAAETVAEPFADAPHPLEPVSVPQPIEPQVAEPFTAHESAFGFEAAVSPATEAFSADETEPDQAAAELADLLPDIELPDLASEPLAFTEPPQSADAIVEPEPFVSDEIAAAPSEPIEPLAPIADLEPFGDQQSEPISIEPAEEPAAAEPQVEAFDFAALQPVPAHCADLPVAGEPLEANLPSDSNESIEETPAGRSAAFVEASEAEPEISLLEEQPGSVNSLDPLSDSFPLIETIEEVVVPQDLQAFANASAAIAPMYSPVASPPPAEEELSLEDLADVPISEKLSPAPDEYEAPAQFIDSPDAAVSEPVESSAVTAGADEPLDLADLEFIEPDTAVTHSAPVTEFFGISTVDELHADDLQFGEDPDQFEEISGFEPLDESVDSPSEEELSEPAQASLQESSPVAEVGTVAPAASDTSADFDADTAAPSADSPSDISPEIAHADTPTVPTEASNSSAAVVPNISDPPTGGPSIFGFQFEGGSFLGGMPISLTGKGSTPAALKVAPPSPIFDARATPPTGLGEMLVAPPAAPANTSPARSVPRSETPPRPARATAPTLSKAPATLSGLVSDAAVPWAAAPVIPPIVAKTAASAAAARKGLTSNFSALDQAPRIADVFSQMSAPIGVEVFGGRPGDPNQFTVPDTKRSDSAATSTDLPAGAASDAAAESLAELSGESSADAAIEPAMEADDELAVSTGPSKLAGLLPVKPRRKSRLPWLLILCVLVPALLAGSIWKFVPISAQVVGSLPFEGLLLQQPTDVHAFHLGQEQLLWSDEVRNTAQNLLQNQGLPLGFTGDDDTYHSMVASEYLNWKDNGNFQLTSNSTNEKLITAQVNAVLTALAQKDRDLDAARNAARSAAAAAKLALDDATAKVAEVDKQYHDMLDKAGNYPPATAVSRADEQRDQLNQQWQQAKLLRQSSEKALADLRSQNPTAVVDINADPDVKALQGQLQPLLDQIAKLKGFGSIDSSTNATAGADIVLGATTQPDTDPLIAPLQQQADLIAKKLDARRAEIAAEASITPEQRAVDQSRAIEDLSVKITALLSQENQAKTTADAAAAKANAYDAQVSAAKLAGIQAQELYTTLSNAQDDQKRAANDSESKESALATCVTVKGPPTVTTQSITDMRPKLAAAASVGSWILLGFLIAGELRRPKKVTIASVRPAAAPLVNPPVRITPWPQPRQNGSQHPDPGSEPPILGEPDQVFGV